MRVLQKYGMHCRAWKFSSQGPSCSGNLLARDCRDSNNPTHLCVAPPQCVERRACLGAPEMFNHMTYKSTARWVV